ncbi:MAG: DUF2975 domain-containing protein [Bacteroidetes bacterium]|nr:DUF2975 domain-containing protein [Bacteroidota bacterium]MBU1485174.1 DUF2975 domain-containing protein [Bacteroidota bacterium]MBU1762178.1 DUF2975 domain-containing protein [Bacteroidota bacterium]MBU2269376.1 DUF2975 domain-containing protein [Bacteroidota bacterium]MBU2376614.1 DUF2975 domain-containing protein [Bacteroidota bacterium]
MNTKLILSFLRIATSFLFYFLIVVIFFVLAKDVYDLYSEKSDYVKIDQNAYYKDLSASKSIDLYSTDNKIQYQKVTDLFTINAEAHSSLSFYYMLATLVFLFYGLILLWNFKKLFEGINMQQPFKSDLIKRLNLLAIIFILSDVFGLIHYFIINALIQHSLEIPKLRLLTNLGDGIITGLIILVIAMVYQRGVEIEEENSLTV